MAKFQTTIQDQAVEALTEIIAQGKTLTITRAQVGDGASDDSPNTLTDLIHPIDVAASLGLPEFVEGDPSYMKIPVQVTNALLEAPVFIREVGVYARNAAGKEILFARSYLIGGDSDNILPAPGNMEDEEGDTIHIHDMAVALTTAQAASVSIEIGVGSFVTESRLKAYAAPLDHRHGASAIDEASGDSVEVVQRRQDADLASIREQLDTGFTGTTVTHTFSAAQLANWTGYDGTGLPEGVLDSSTNTLYL